MNSEMKINISPITRLGDKRVAYVLFTDKSANAEFIIPGGELLRNEGFDEKALAELKEYLESEQRVINELRAINKPFIVLLNSIEPDSRRTLTIAEEMSREYSVPVLPVSCMELSENEIKRILAQLLFEFPIKEIKVDIPKWLVTLDKEHWLKSVVFDSIKNS